MSEFTFLPQLARYNLFIYSKVRRFKEQIRQRVHLAVIDLFSGVFWSFFINMQADGEL